MPYTQSPLPLSGRPPVAALDLSPDRFLPSVTLALPAGECRVPLRDLPTLFAPIPDPRRAQRREFPLAALLAPRAWGLPDP